jgi:alkanesulfonate monooxygenase SsuD/methylene tetrahydromethanopterin reductase-like flavin-dependent oxidoreductase (luciferase family)
MRWHRHGLTSKMVVAVIEYHGEIVDFPPMMTWPKPVQKPHPPIIVGGAFRFAARRAIRYGDGILPAAPSAGSGSPEEFMPRFRHMAVEAGRDPRELSVTLGGAPEDIDVLKRNRSALSARGRSRSRRASSALACSSSRKRCSQCANRASLAIEHSGPICASRLICKSASIPINETSALMPSGRRGHGCRN